MEKDILKNFILDNRDAFDNEMPPDLWMKIDSVLEERCNNQKSGLLKKIDLVFKLQTRVWQFAAAILLLAVVGMGTYIYFQPTNSTASSIEKISPELADAEFYYTSQIIKKQEVLKKSCMSDLCTKDLKSLDVDYNQLKQELYKDINNQQISNAMVQNLQIRMKILNEQLEMVEKVKMYQNNKNYKK